MSKQTLDKKIIAEMAEKIWAKVRELQEARKKAFEEHKAYRVEMLPYMTELGRETSKGCADAAKIAGQIEQIIAVGKMLGLIDKEVDYLDHI